MAGLSAAFIADQRGAQRRREAEQLRRAVEARKRAEAWQKARAAAAGGSPRDPQEAVGMMFGAGEPIKLPWHDAVGSGLGWLRDQTIGRLPENLQGPAQDAALVAAMFGSRGRLRGAGRGAAPRGGSGAPAPVVRPGAGTGTRTGPGYGTPHPGVAGLTGRGARPPLTSGPPPPRAPQASQAGRLIAPNTPPGPRPGSAVPAPPRSPHDYLQPRPSITGAGRSPNAPGGKVVAGTPQDRLREAIRTVGDASDAGKTSRASMGTSAAGAAATATGTLTNAVTKGAAAVGMTTTAARTSAAAFGKWISKMSGRRRLLIAGGLAVGGAVAANELLNLSDAPADQVSPAGEPTPSEPWRPQVPGSAGGSGIPGAGVPAAPTGDPFAQLTSGDPAQTADQGARSGTLVPSGAPAAAGAAPGGAAFVAGMGAGGMGAGGMDAGGTGAGGTGGGGAVTVEDLTIAAAESAAAGIGSQTVIDTLTTTAGQLIENWQAGQEAIADGPMLTMLLERADAAAAEDTARMAAAFSRYQSRSGAAGPDSREAWILTNAWNGLMTEYAERQLAREQQLTQILGQMSVDGANSLYDMMLTSVQGDYDLTAQTMEQQWRSGEMALDRSHASGLAAADRSWRSGEAALDRGHQSGMAQLGREWDIADREDAQSHQADMAAAAHTAELDRMGYGANLDAYLAGLETDGRSPGTAAALAAEDMLSAAPESQAAFDYMQSAWTRHTSGQGTPFDDAVGRIFNGLYQGDKMTVKDIENRLDRALEAAFPPPGAGLPRTPDQQAAYDQHRAILGQVELTLAEWLRRRDARVG